MLKSSWKSSSIPENGHWTARSPDDFLSRITFDFARQVEDCLDAKKENQATLAKRLELTDGRVSQILNKPASMSLRTIVKFARAVNRKVAIVLYNDGDSENRKGPINSEIFFNCWEMAGKPADFFELRSANTTTFHYMVVPSLPLGGNVYTHAASWNPHKTLYTEIGAIGEFLHLPEAVFSGVETRTFVQ